MAFDDIRFPVDISYGSSGTPSYRTDVIVLESKQELRASLDEFPTYVYDVAYGVKTTAQMSALHTFFHGRKGMARTFRYKDHLDFEGVQSPLVVTGLPTIQLTKRYTSGTETLDRAIYKPTQDFNPFTMRRNTLSFTAFVLDNLTGILTLTPDSTSSIASASSVVINGITQASNGVVTTAAVHNLTTGFQVNLAGIVGMTELNGLSATVTVLTTTTFELNIDTTTFTAYISDGTMIQPGVSTQNPGMVRSVAHGRSSSEVVYILSVGGMTEINLAVYTVTVIDVDNFTIGVDTSAFTPYTSGGTIENHVQPTEDLDWSGEFDIRGRFGADTIPAVHDAFDIGTVGPISIIEVIND